MAEAAVIDATAQAVVGECARRGLTVACGESLTAGLVAATIAEVPGCSAVLRGAVVAYHRDIKARMLEVPYEVLDRGLVTREVAVGMAEGAARILSADLGVGTTGAAGPDPHDGVEPGSAWVAVSGPTGATARHLRIAGDRESIRRQTATASLTLLLDLVRSMGE